MSPNPNPPLDWTAITAEAIEHFKALLRIPTVNPPGNERPAADYLARLFTAEGIDFTIVESEPTRASIVARLPAKKPSGKGPLLLNGHLDVVAVDRDEWTHDPFAAVEADGCIWGRGAIDMKNMVTMSAMTLVLLKRAGVATDRDVIFAGVADEEAGSRKGAVFLVEQHPELVRSEYVLNEVGGHTLHMGSARYYPIQVAEKGICWFEIVAEGEPGHGSMPHRENPVLKIARAIQSLSRLSHRPTPVVETFLRTIAKGAPFPQSAVLPLLLNPRLAGTLLDVVERVQPDRAKSLGAMVHNTASPTILEAGTKVNVIPSRASAKVDGRMMPGLSIREFLDDVQRVIGPGLKITVFEEHEGVSFSTDTPLYRAIEKTLAAHDPGGVPVPYMIPGFTDSFAYARLGATCYGFSPVRLGPELEFTRMYHGHDERIPRDGFAWGMRVLYELVRDFVG